MNNPFRKLWVSDNGNWTIWSTPLDDSYEISNVRTGAFAWTFPCETHTHYCNARQLPGNKIPAYVRAQVERIRAEGK